MRGFRSVGDIATGFARRLQSVRPEFRTPERVPELRAAPVSLGGTVARQTDPTTCGSASLVMLAATGDPVLATWLETGELPDGLESLPPEIPPGVEGRKLTAEERFSLAQHRVKAATCERALGPFPWPSGLGTPPWTAARHARFPGVRYVSQPVDDRGESGEAFVATLLNALRNGLPVLLYTGGTLATGAVTAAPRHVVLAVPARPRVDEEGRPVISIYEPSSGKVVEIRADELRDRTRPHPALGNWSNVQWIVRPVPR